MMCFETNAYSTSVHLSFISHSMRKQNWKIMARMLTKCLCKKCNNQYYLLKQGAMFHTNAFFLLPPSLYWHSPHRNFLSLLHPCCPLQSYFISIPSKQVFYPFFPPLGSVVIILFFCFFFYLFYSFILVFLTYLTDSYLQSDVHFLKYLFHLLPYFFLFFPIDQAHFCVL